MNKNQVILREKKAPLSPIIFQIPTITRCQKIYSIMDKINVYKHPPLPTPKIKPTLKKLLLVCNTQVPFYDHSRNIFTQYNGVAMGSPIILILPELCRS